MLITRAKLTGENSKVVSLWAKHLRMPSSPAALA